MIGRSICPKCCPNTGCGDNVLLPRHRNGECFVTASRTLLNSRLILPQAFADLPQPYYWWECGALMGAMLDYAHYTKDQRYEETVVTAILAQTGPKNDFMVPAHRGDEGNDDQIFWNFAVMAAAERNVAQPPSKLPSWLDLSQNIWNSVIARWNTSSCGGGVQWQIFPDNPNGMNYKNTVSNGGLFQSSARLYRATGNQTYLEWANKIWDWTTGVGMIDDKFNVYDGADSSDNCTKINPVSFSYSAAIYMYGAAVMANATGDKVWQDRAAGILSATTSGANSFFSPFANATDVMWEHACEGVNKCNTDMKSFKGYMSRFMWASTQMQPALAPTVDKYLQTSAGAAANACTGGKDGNQCGQKWYVGGFDGSIGLGQQMSALETVQGLLVKQAPAPLKGAEIKDVRSNVDTAPPAPTATPSSSPSPTKRSNAAGCVGVNLRLAICTSLVGMLAFIA